jgi:hypothetical protein
LLWVHKKVCSVPKEQILNLTKVGKDLRNTFKVEISMGISCRILALRSATRMISVSKEEEEEEEEENEGAASVIIRARWLEIVR